MIDTIWSSKLDGRYDCAVTRTGPYQGKLTIEDAGTTIFEQDVGLAYGAIFGPDVDDVPRGRTSAARKSTRGVLSNSGTGRTGGPPVAAWSRRFQW